MHALQCPACGKQCLSSSRKLFLAPARSISCASCGARVSVTWFASMALIALQSCVMVVTGVLALMLASPFSSLYTPIVIFALGSAVGTAPFLWAYVRFVPLVVRGA